MTRGKQICRKLKDIRRRIAEANGIEYVAEECRYEDDCSGTCPRCEAEAAALWHQLNMRRAAGRAVVLAGLSAGLLTASAQSNVGAGQGCGSCHASCQSAAMSSRNPVVEDVDTIKVMHNNGKAEPRLSENEDDRQVFGAINEVMPQFMGGVKTMTDYVRLSVDSIMDERNLKVDSQSAGRCIVSFTVRKDGSIADVKVVKKLNDAFDSVAVDVVKGMPRWNPGKRNGRCIDVRYTIPIMFRVYSDDGKMDKMQQ